MRFRKKPVVVDAVQWFKDGDHPAVEPRPVQIIFDRAGAYFYVAHVDDRVPMANAWLAVDVTKPASSHGPVLPFAFYEVKSGATAPVSAHPLLAAAYASQQGWTRTPRDLGYLRSREIGRGRVVAPGDWIVTEGDVASALSADEFAAAYEPMGGAGDLGEQA